MEKINGNKIAFVGEEEGGVQDVDPAELNEDINELDFEAAPEELQLKGSSKKEKNKDTNSRAKSAIAIYLKQIGRYKILTRAEEQEIGARMDEVREEICKLEKRRTRAKKEETIAKIDKQIARATNELKQLKDTFVSHNLRLVVNYAKRYRKKGNSKVPLLDIIQDGNEGLMKAAERFDHKKGYKFATYAMWWILQSINRAHADTAKAIRIPVHMLDARSKIYKTRKAIHGRRGFHPDHAPTPEEIAKATGIEVRKLKTIENLPYAGFSVDAPVGDEDGRSFIDFQPDKKSIPADNELITAARKKVARDLLNQLDTKKRKILMMRFGVDAADRDSDGITLEKVGEIFELTRERIRQLEAEALKILRHKMMIIKNEGRI